MQKIRVLIVDDQKLFCASLKVVLEGESKGEIQIVGIAYNGKEALRMIPSKKPDIILMDVRMPDMDGVKATGIIKKKYPDIKIIILTTFDDDDYVFSALKNGAVGYVLKDLEPEELVSSVKSIFAGTMLFSSTVASRIINQAKKGSIDRLEEDEHTAKINFLLSHFSMLSRREAEVLHLIIQNLDNKEISDKLFIAEQTVKNYISRIYTKLGVNDRIHAIQRVKNKI